MITVKIQKSNRKSKRVSDMESGDVGVVRDSTSDLLRSGTILMRTFSQWVDLEDPSNTWSGAAKPSGFVDLVDIKIEATYQ